MNPNRFLLRVMLVVTCGWVTGCGGASEAGPRLKRQPVHESGAPEAAANNPAHTRKFVR